MASSSGGRIFTGESSSAPGGDRRIPRGQVDGNLGEHIFDTELPSSLGDIARIIRVAKEFQASNPRVAYLCYFYAFEKAYRLDPASSGEGVRQFKTALLQRLEMENDPTMKGRVKKSDVREMRNFYQHFYKYNIQAVQTAAGKAGRKIPYETEAVLFEVLKAINTSQKIEVDQAILEIHKQVNKDIKYYCPYNILPLDHDSANNAIMQYPEIQAALLALRNTAGLQWPEEHEKMPDEDLLGWLQATFGFQRDNVSNQREHLILLLANVHIRRNPKPDQQLKLDDQALDAVMRKLLKNYRKWCKYLEQRSSLWLPTTQLEVQQRKLLYVGLYLLIWGEAANLRFMPECLCYIYHHMCFEVYSLLTGYVNPTTSKNVKPAYGGKEEDFLKNVVTPIYQVIEKEAQISKSKRSSSKHSHWRNYDDLNEYFWSKDCFRLGWPMRADANFFTTRYSAPNNAFSSVQCVRKVNFVEIRSFWHIFRSFDRMWSFLILSLQAIIIISWNGGPPSDIFDGRVFKQVLSIFITAAILKLGQALMEIVFTWKARGGMSFAVKLWYIMKLLLATAWVIILPVTYIHTWENPSGVAGTIKSWLRLGEGWIQPSSYKLAVVIYLGPNMLAATLFLFPFIRGCLESSNLRVITFMMWWSQPCVFVGRGTHGGIYALFKYTMFWVLLLAAKLTMSYYLEIKPLVQLTKDIMKEPIWTLPQHELSPHAFNNVGVMLALWTPIILVYFMDTHIWYAIFSTFIGGIYGAWNRIGEIRTIGMVRSRFKYLLKSFNQRLSPSDSNKRGFSSAFSSKPCKTPEDGKEEEEIAARFAQYWNLIITSFREEDLIDNREKNFLLVPYCKDREMDTIQWPPFLLASKIPLAVDMATDSNGIDRDIKKKMKSDPYYTYAIKECYASFKNIIYTLVVGPRERELIGEIFTIVDYNITHDTLLQELNMRCFPFLYNQFVELLELLKRNSEEDKGMVIILFQDMFEVVLRDIVESELNGLLDEQDQLFVNAIDFPVKVSQTWTEKIKRLYLLLTVKESATDVPTNPEARRRISFFANSLFMKMPSAPKVRHMMSFSVLTPHHREQVLFSSHVLEEQNEDGLSILSYLQKMYPDEWTNFLERVRCQNEELRETEQLDDEIRLWASYRGQTLTRTVRGMMYYRQTLVLQSFLDMARDDDLMKGFRTADILSDESPLLTQCKALADMKFTYVVSCRQYGIMKRCGDPCAHDILRLMATYPSLRVAYIDEVEERRKDENTITKVYYSSLVKVDSCHRGMKLDQLIYRIKLPGNEMLGEEKPENQNHAIIFTRGEGLQTIDMNQDHYMEETLKIRNMLQEFLNKHDGVRYPTILGVKEHIYTSSASSLAWLTSNQETSFVTIGQRVLANPLRVRFHYGHSDIFDRLFHLTRGGVSKASKIINLSGDIFAGFNTTLRAGNVTHHEYMQVGKGVDVDLDQISLLEATIAYGNGEQTLSRDVYRLGHCFDFFRMLSCYYSTVGSYFSTMIMLWTVYVFLYGRFYLVVSGLDEALPTGKSFIQNKSLQVALASQSVVQLGFLMALPMMMEICLERGIRTASRDFVLMQVQLASVFFAFSLGTKTHYYGTTLLHGGAKRRTARNGFVVFHAKFAENYRLYSKSHFTKGIELMFLLVIYEIFGQSYRGSILCIFITFSMWFMVVTWLFAPFLFNPYGFEWHRIVDDWTDWNKWISNPGGIGIPPERSWESWWEKEQETLRYSGKRGTALEIVLALRFFTYQYGLVYHLSITKHTRSVLVYGLSWVVIVVILLVAMTVSAGRRRYREEFQHVFRLIKGLIFITSISALIILIAISHLTIQDIFVCVLAFSPTGCGLILVAQALKPVIVMIGLWSYVKALARGYDIAMGFLLFSPVVLLAWFPFVSEFQTRIIFNPAFSRGLQTSWILGRHKGDPAVRKEI